MNTFKFGSNVVKQDADGNFIISAEEMRFIALTRSADIASNNVTLFEQRTNFERELSITHYNFWNDIYEAAKGEMS